MEFPASHYPPDRSPVIRDPIPAVRWVKEWVPQELAATGGKCSLLRWVREDMLKALKEKSKEPEAEELKPEPTTEVLFLCSYEGCGKTFIDVGALRKHAHIHGERQYACHYTGCGKKFFDSSKLKRHFLIHTGERDYVCPHEGCGKAFSLDFNLRAHMKTHLSENYHVCTYPECGKRFMNESKLRSHLKTHHEKNAAMDTTKPTPPAEKPQSTPKTPAASAYSVASSDRPHACPYEGCGKAYIHEYKLNLHLRREHPGHNPEENGKHTPAARHAMEEASDDAYIAKNRSGKKLKRSRPNNPVQKMPPARVANRKVSSSAAVNANTVKKQLRSKEEYEEDSEETEEDGDNGEEGWRYGGMDGDDEETEDED